MCVYVCVGVLPVYMYMFRYVCMCVCFLSEEN